MSVTGVTTEGLFTPCIWKRLHTRLKWPLVIGSYLPALNAIKHAHYLASSSYFWLGFNIERDDAWCPAFFQWATRKHGREQQQQHLLKQWLMDQLASECQQDKGTARWLPQANAIMLLLLILNFLWIEYTGFTSWKVFGIVFIFVVKPVG